ncbi:MAG TPA: glycoside hydrolase family 18 protein [Candidatus Baltobacteraceae bacterium]|nr:glycoside hydrolase family 18 protein [Candidatus Baltobacteraceae bacterium]
MPVNVLAAAAFVVAAYYNGAVPVEQIPADRLTDVIFAFGEPGEGNVCHDASPRQAAIFAQLRKLRAEHPHLRLLLSIGGWSAAPQFSDAALTATSRAAFARSCIASYIVREGFDGIDLDWEFPVRGGVSQNPHRPQDRADATALAQEIRSELDTLGAAAHRHYYLTAAVPAGRYENGGAYSASDSYDLAAFTKSLDWMNLMTYDMGTTFSPTSNFNAPMNEDPNDPTPAAQRIANNVTGAVASFEAAGVPASKIVLGVPFYGRGFTGVGSDRAGLYSSYSGGYPEVPWSVVSSRYLHDPQWERHWSDTAQEPWLYNAATHTFFSYDDPRAVAAKSAFVKRAGLRGAMFWVLGQDDAEQSLLRALSGPLLPSP